MQRVIVPFVVLWCVLLLGVAQGEVITIAGTIKSVDANKRTITVETGGEEKTLDVSSKAKISTDGKDGGLDALKAGQQVKLSYHDDLEIVLKIEGLTTPFHTSSHLELISVSKIWDRSPSNQFTDLCVYNDEFLCVFREGSDRMSMDGSIRVLASKDGEKWSPVSEIRLDGFDLRDAKICVTGDGNLMIYSGASKRSGQVLEKLNTVVSFSSDGRQWSKPAVVGEPDMWLWNPTWYDKKLYVVGYHAKEPWLTTLYLSANGKTFDAIVPELQSSNMPVEGALAFDGSGLGVCVLRRGAGTKTALLGIAKKPFQVWNWSDTNLEIASPDMATLPDGRILLAARLKEETTQTALLWIDPNSSQLTKVLTLPGSGD